MKKLTKILAVTLVAIMSLLVLVACAPNSDPEKARESLKKNEFSNSETIDAITAGAFKLSIDGVDTVVSGTKSSKDEDGKTKIDMVTIVYFYEASQAKEAYSKLASDAEKDKDDESDWVFEQSGKLVYWGTKAGVKAAR